ncbi:MAG TPA: rhomboid family intramembrane serine protease [Flavobacteriales bacterium]|nr:rhomboid family intramembrane serine protease [Flavobacteriales bacterium]
MAEFEERNSIWRKQGMHKQERRYLLRPLIIPVILVGIAWTVWWLVANAAVEFGVRPQTLKGLAGIFFSPFIHDPKDVSHLINNSLPLLFLGWALFYFYRELSWKVLAWIWFLSGFWVWIAVQDESVHIGASGIVYGLASFLFFSGVIRRQRNLMGLTLIVSFFYGGMVWGVFPYDLRISWQSHLFGGIAGLILAIVYRKKGWQREKYAWEDEVVTENFSQLNERHEAVLHGKIKDPNEIDEDPPFTINYEFVSKE